eukprot:XP_001700582.1 predicted protein [Chlamydomonas reinhardtii]
MVWVKNQKPSSRLMTVALLLPQTCSAAEAGASGRKGAAAGAGGDGAAGDEEAEESLVEGFEDLVVDEEEEDEEEGEAWECRCVFVCVTFALQDVLAASWMHSFIHPLETRAIEGWHGLSAHTHALAGAVWE